jgi:capsular exopolysaccharide synthesis family protein
MAGELHPSNLPSGYLTPHSVRVPAEEPEFAIGEPQGAGIPWRRYRAAVARHKWLILAVTALGTVLSIVATRFVKPQYTVTATVFVERPIERNGPIRAAELLESNQWIELLKTNLVLDSVVQRTALFVRPARLADSSLFQGFQLADRFRPGSYALTMDPEGGRVVLEAPDRASLGSYGVGDSVGKELGFHWQPHTELLRPGQRVAFTVISPRDASATLLGSLRTQMTERGNFMRISLTSNDPVQGAAVINILTDQFVSVAADLKRAKLRETAKILREQLNYSAEQLRGAERSLEEFRVRTITLPSDVPVAAGIQLTQPTVIRQFFEEKVEVDSLARERQAIQTALAQFEAGTTSADAFRSIPSVVHATELNRALAELSDAEAQLRVMKQKFTDEYRPVKDLQERVTTGRTKMIPTLARQLSEQMQTRQTAIERHIATASRDLQDIPLRAINEQRLSREMQAADALYRNLQQRYEEAKLAEASALPDVKVLDPAVPPSRPNKNLAIGIISMGFLGSIAAALGLAILLDMIDHRVRYADEIETELGLTILGAVPRIRRRAGLAQDPQEAAQVVEAFRAIRLNLAHRYGSAGPVLLTVSSPEAADGKSFVSSNLALSFAESGYNVVLIDGDTRRGELHRSFGIDRKPGLLDCASGTATLDQILRSGGHPNLTVIPSGTRFERGPELLGGPAMRELVVELKRRYNCVIVDSPPLGAGIDPFVLGALTGSLVLVLRAGETDRGLTLAKLRLFDRLPVRILGAILNDVRTTESAYKQYSYIYGYTANELEPYQEATSRAITP